MKIREDTILEHFLLFCLKCKQEMLINVKQLNISIIKEPDAPPITRKIKYGYRLFHILLDNCKCRHIGILFWLCSQVVKRAQTKKRIRPLSIMGVLWSIKGQKSLDLCCFWGVKIESKDIRFNTSKTEFYCVTKRICRLLRYTRFIWSAVK